MAGDRCPRCLALRRLALAKPCTDFPHAWHREFKAAEAFVAPVAPVVPPEAASAPPSKKGGQGG